MRKRYGGYPMENKVYWDGGIGMGFLRRERPVICGKCRFYRNRFSTCEKGIPQLKKMCKWFVEKGA